MDRSNQLVVPIMDDPLSAPPAYLPDEILLQILEYIPRRTLEGQQMIASFCGVNRQWYDVAISRLYASPILIGSAYALFVRTICPSILAHIKKSSLAGLVKTLDLSLIVHQSNKSTTARLLGRTKPSLEVFVAPQASFAINCWASLSKCSKLRKLDLSLVSEQISFQSLNQTLKQLPALTDLRLPRCATRNDEATILSQSIRWPPHLTHLSLSGTIHGKFLWDMLRTPHTFPPPLHSLGINHAPGLDHTTIRTLLQNLAQNITTLSLRDLPAVKQGRFNPVLTWLPHLRNLTIALDYISTSFGHKPASFTSAHFASSKPLESLTLVTSGGLSSLDPARAFTAVDLFQLLDDRYLGRLRYLTVAASSGWADKNEGAELEALYALLVKEVDRESWVHRRWHYSGLEGVPQGMGYERWIVETEVGRRMMPVVRIIRDRC